MTPEQLSEHGRRAVNARWSRMTFEERREATQPVRDAWIAKSAAKAAARERAGMK